MLALLPQPGGFEGFGLRHITLSIRTIFPPGR